MKNFFERLVFNVIYMCAYVAAGRWGAAHLSVGAHRVQRHPIPSGARVKGGCERPDCGCLGLNSDHLQEPYMFLTSRALSLAPLTNI